MPTKRSLPAALKLARKARGLSQEAFADVSSRTYMSTLERGMKSPTLSKLTAISQVLSIHPMTLLALSYAGESASELDNLLAKIRREFTAITGKS
ncbi:helix-turn-helix domain-containing protein [Tahibacter amnicola]|uniref:Helix-turn-helix domain-containing protein n=1 Tax=Tahibacter amnicola TaxID=2976241 RepID=A0ABY6B9A8_9GAMM|nr:helix-turn-helix transcriptional regulator [Tahibacter amnicola]UXI66121.1 helix-turn-helix domain-containing protein [Tahibacter amnicola]